MKKILTIIFAISIISKGFTSDKVLLIFKPNETLKYKIQLQPFPENALAKQLTGIYSDLSIVKISIKENNNDTLMLSYTLTVFDKKSCCNPLSYPGYFYTVGIEIENLIKPSGEFIKNESDYVTSNCILGFNLFRFKRRQSEVKKPVVFPFYFPDQEISIGESWNNIFEYVNEGKPDKILINYTLKSITSNIAYIDGYNLLGLHITSHFDIVKGCLIDFKMYFKKDSKEYLFKSFELIE